MKKRQANKLPCPCNSGRRVGQCHHLEINRLRNKLGRSWFRTIAYHLSVDAEYRATLPEPASFTRTRHREIAAIKGLVPIQTS
jgi:hypothetical protein